MERFLQGDMFTTNYLLYKVLLITNYTKLTLLISFVLSWLIINDFENVMC